MKILDNQFNKMLLKSGEIVGFLCLAIALLVASNTPANGDYEVDIYQVYPAFFWVLIATTIILGVSTALGEIFLFPRSYNWVYGFFLVVITNILILSLQILRDYGFASQWDDVNHFSSMMNLVEYGHPAPDNFYPISHILGAVYALLTGLELQIVALLFPIFFYLVYLSSLAFVAWTVDKRPGVRGLILIWAVPLVFSTYGIIFRPTHFAVYMLPLFVGWLFRTRFQKTGWMDSIPFVLIMILLSFLHPWAVISAATITLAFGLAYIWNHVQRADKYNNMFMIPLLILGVTWLTWFMTFSIFGTTVARLIQSFVEELGAERNLAQYMSTAQQAELSFSKIISLIIYTYGPTILYASSLGVVIVWILIQIVRRNRIPIHILALFTSAILFGVLATLSLFRDLITQNPLRLSNFMVALIPMLAGSLFYYLAVTQKPANSMANVGKLFFKGGILVVLVASSILGIFNTYASPLIGQPNYQFSYAQQAGLDFLLDKAVVDDDKHIYTPSKGGFVIASVVNKEELKQLRQNPTWQIKNAPAHFGYETDELGFTFEKPGYLWVTAYEKAYYTDVWPEKGRFTPQDFKKLENDTNWHQIYTSGDITIWQYNNSN